MVVKLSDDTENELVVGTSEELVAKIVLVELVVRANVELIRLVVVTELVVVLIKLVVEEVCSTALEVVVVSCDKAVIPVVVLVSSVQLHTSQD